jgi:hypothetical protein
MSELTTVGGKPIPDTAEGSEWLCHHCRFRTTELRAALDHPYEPGTSNFAHWIYEHPQGSRMRSPTREIHSSDMGGVYITGVPEWLSERVVREYRDRQPGGVF